MADAPKPRRRWLRRLLVVLFAVGLLIFFAPAMVARTGLLQSLADKALVEFDGKVSLGSATLGWFAPVELHNVRVTDPQGRMIAEVPKIATQNTLLALMLDSKSPGTVTLERPAIEIVCENNTTNLETTLTKLLEKPGDPNAPKPRLNVVVNDAKLTVKDVDQKKEWLFTGVTASADLGDSTRVKVAIREPQSLELEAAFGPQLIATLNAKGFPIDVAGPFLRRFEPGLSLSGELSGEIATETQGERTSLVGKVDILTFEAASPRLGPDRISVPNVHSVLRANVSGPQIQFQDAVLTCDLGRVKASGPLDTSKLPESLAHQPGVNVSAEADLARIAKMLPALFRLRPGTELQEGRLEFQLVSKARGTDVIWDGALKSTALKGLRAGQPLRWDQPIVATFTGQLNRDFWPEFESLDAVSDFAKISARGKYEQFNAEGFVSLDLLGQHLAEFIDLTGITLAGQANFTATGSPDKAATQIVAALKFADFAAAFREKAAAEPVWQFAGRGDLAARVRVDATTMKFDSVAGTLENAKFRGLGLNVDEPTVRVLPTDIAIDRPSGRVSIPRLQFATQTISLGANDISISREGMTLTGAMNADLSRLQKTLQLAGEPIGGLVKNATVDMKTAQGSTRMTAKVPVLGFRYGSATKPVWSEPNLTFAWTGLLDSKADRLTLETLTLERPDGLAVQVAGSIRELSTSQTLDLNGQLQYDLAAFEPQLKDLLGKSVKAVGKDRKPFHLQGRLEDPTLLIGDASVGWQSVSAYGFDIGASRVDANLDRGVLSTKPIEATIGTTGKLKLQPTIRFEKRSADLSFTRGRLIDKATLTPAACAEAIGYALPAIARSAQAEGTISFDLDEHQIPLNEIARSRGKGILTLHNVSVTAGPVIGTIVDLLDAKQKTLTLAKEQGVNVRVENGRVFHDNLALTLGGYAISTSGSVGLDGSLSLAIQLPVPDSAIGPALKNVPKIREAITNKKFTVSLGGTLANPKLDRAAFNAALAQFVRDVTRESAKGALNDLFQKGLDKAIPKKP